MLIGGWTLICHSVQLPKTPEKAKSAFLQPRVNLAQPLGRVNRQRRTIRVFFHKVEQESQPLYPTTLTDVLRQRFPADTGAILLRIDLRKADPREMAMFYLASRASQPSPRIFSKMRPLNPLALWGMLIALRIAFDYSETSLSRWEAKQFEQERARLLKFAPLLNRPPHPRHDPPT